MRIIMKNTDRIENEELAHKAAQKEWHNQRVQDRRDAMAKVKDENPNLNRKERKKLARKIYQKGWYDSEL
jgi:hypothetical protein